MTDKNQIVELNIDAPHMGELLRNHLKTHGISGASLAWKMQRSPVSVSNYYKNQSLQMRVIWDISHALEYNFFEEIAKMLPKEFSKNKLSENLELEKLRAENELLKELLKR